MFVKAGGHEPTNHAHDCFRLNDRRSDMAVAEPKADAGMKGVARAACRCSANRSGGNISNFARAHASRRPVARAHVRGAVDRHP